MKIKSPFGSPKSWRVLVDTGKYYVGVIDTVYQNKWLQ